MRLLEVPKDARGGEAGGRSTLTGDGVAGLLHLVEVCPLVQFERNCVELVVRRIASGGHLGRMAMWATQKILSGDSKGEGSSSGPAFAVYDDRAPARLAKAEVLRQLEFGEHDTSSEGIGVFLELLEACPQLFPGSSGERARRNAAAVLITRIGQGGEQGKAAAQVGTDPKPLLKAPSAEITCEEVSRSLIRIPKRERAQALLRNPQTRKRPSTSPKPPHKEVSRRFLKTPRGGSVQTPPRRRFQQKVLPANGWGPCHRSFVGSSSSRTARGGTRIRSGYESSC